MEYIDISYISGLSTMFFGMMAVFFWRKGERLHKLVTLLMLTISLQCIKDFIILRMGMFYETDYWEMSTAFDMVAVPMYAFILTELVRPGHLTLKSMVWQELPFVLLPVLYIITNVSWLFYIEVAWAAIYGTTYLIWTAISIPRYNRYLKEQYSYTENVNLNWLRIILYTFYIILGLWIFDSIAFHFYMECVYMICNLLLWMVISFFLFRHESVIDELSDWTPEINTDEVTIDNSLAKRIEELFVVKKVFLKADLKLSDIAKEVGSNRTYVSKFFNSDSATNFYSYVNSHRVAYACTLLSDGSIPIQDIAIKSGFSCGSVFSRVFAKHKGCSPTAYREKKQKSM